MTQWTRLVTAMFRMAFRGMLSQAGERTLIGVVCPPGAAHINGVQSTAFKRLPDLVYQAGFSATVIADFFVKSTGRSNLHFIWEQFPRLPWSPAAVVRTLALNCLTRSYALLWNDCWDAVFERDQWASADQRLPVEFFSCVRPKAWAASTSISSSAWRRA